MKLIRKRDAFRNIDLNGDMSIGECIDKCETLDLSDLIIELEEIRYMTFKQDKEERLEQVIDQLKRWGWNEKE